MDNRYDPRRIEVLDDAMVEVLRKKSPVERVALVLEANETMRLLLEAHFRDRHPEWDDGQISAAIAGRLLRDSD